MDGYKKQTPVGKIVPFEIPETLISQLKDERSGMEFSDTTFYVDMFGEALESANEDDIKFKFDMAAVILFWVGTFGSHMIGAKIGFHKACQHYKNRSDCGGQRWTAAVFLGR